MKKLILALLSIAPALLSHAGDAAVTFEGAACSTPPKVQPALHCPDADCPTAVIINQGMTVEMATRRTYFLDYPCDLKQGEPVTLILSLHGGGSYGNWQRHYFPLMDFVNQHRLVVMTPNSPIRVWTEVDDKYLENIVEDVVRQLGVNSVRAFWLVGHSQGGMTSNRILRSPYFKDRVDGWLSLSGGRLGGNPERAENFGPAPTQPQDDAARERMRTMSATFARAAQLLSTLPENDISFMYTTGVREVSAAGVPATSALAESLGCGARSEGTKITDTKGGYVYDASRQNPPNPSWGLLPGPGDAVVHEFPNCRDGRIVADVVRLEKGHTEGLEPAVTNKLIELMLRAPGGRMQGLTKS